MNVLFNEFVLCLVGCVWFFYFIRKKRNVVMHSRFDVCVLIVLSELICYCEQSCFVLLNVFGIFFFSEDEVLFCDDVCVGFVFLLLFFLERGICYWNKSCFGLAFWVWSCLFFSEGEVLFCDVFLLLSFSSFCFFFGGVEDVFVIGISRVSVWPFGFGII